MPVPLYRAVERNPAKCERFAERFRDNQRNLERDPITFNWITLQDVRLSRPHHQQLMIEATASSHCPAAAGASAGITPVLKSHAVIAGTKLCHRKSEATQMISSPPQLQNAFWKYAAAIDVAPK